MTLFYVIKITAPKIVIKMTSQKFSFSCLSLSNILVACLPL